MINKSIAYINYRSDYINARSLNHDHPIDVSIELTSICNQRCSYCYHADQNDLPFVKGYMDRNLARKVIKDCWIAKVPSIKFNYRGESTLHPYFGNLTRTAHFISTDRIFIDRLTNSNFKFPTNKDEIFEALSYQTKVKISFDSFVYGVMEKQRTGSSRDLALKNIDKFYNWPRRKKSETIMMIQAVRTQLNKDEDIASEVRKRWPEALVSIRDMVSGRVNSDLSSLEHKTRDFSDRVSCIQAHARLIVHHDGKVGVCCPDISGKIIVGDANKNTILEIWNSDKAKEIRRSLLDKTAFENQPCKSCPSFESYKGYKAPEDS